MALTTENNSHATAPNSIYVSCTCTYVCTLCLLYNLYIVLDNKVRCAYYINCTIYKTGNLTNTDLTS